jgi:hypothetical protein
VIIPGVPPDSGATPDTPETRKLILSKPGTTRTKARVDMLGESTRSTLAGFESVAVEAGSVTEVDLTTALMGESTPIAVSAEQPIAASISAKIGDDHVIIPGVLVSDSGRHDMSAPLTGSASLMLTNPSDQPIQVEYQLSENASSAPEVVTDTLPPGTAKEFVVPDTFTSVEVSGPSQLIAAVIAQASADEAAGVAVIPMFIGLADMGDTPLRAVAQIPG